MTKQEHKATIEDILEMSEYVWNVENNIPDSIETFVIYNAMLLLDKIKNKPSFDVVPLPQCGSLEFGWQKGNRYVSVEIKKDSMFIFRKNHDFYEGFECNLDDITKLLQFIDWVEHVE